MTTPKYRTLTEADTVQEGDEFELMTTGEWFPVAHSIDQRGSSHYRRLVEAPCICESNDAILRRLSDTATLLMEANAENHALTNRLEALSAAQVSTDYYFTLLTDIGSMFGLRASISEEGSICDHVIVEKIPELVAELIVKNETLSDVVREEIQPADTIFFQISASSVDEGYCTSLQGAFPNNKVVFLPEGLNFHGAVQIK